MKFLLMLGVLLGALSVVLALSALCSLLVWCAWEFVAVPLGAPVLSFGQVWLALTAVNIILSALCKASK
ncbi:MAG: hypothetical protein HOO67_05460 [Candidatus Peribacteraceae bacterium]|nr:hypothetical protein [Candidatus Peribacteraceae bacterium]